uniref:T-complex protein 11 n=1 Tax=Oryza meridionalis TaxID=40149 RepID=A0A0E0CLZ1_9ORYZ
MGVQEAVAVEIPAAAEAEAEVEEGSPSPPVMARVPPRIRRRLLLRRRGGAPATAEEIEAKLRDADLRRQQFHEALSCKARCTVRYPSCPSQEEDPKKRLEAKLVAAEQKRLNLLAKEQSRLAKLYELRQAAKNDAELRFKKEREELGMKVESRVRQAEEKRTQLMHARSQRRAALEERTTKYLVQRVAWENKYRERVHSAILQKRTAAEKRRMGLLEGEKRRAQGRFSQVQLAARTLSCQREADRSKLKEQLEEKLQRAKRQRAEYLKQRGSTHSFTYTASVKHGDFLSRKLARCWRRFITSRKTTVVLARAFDMLRINEESVKPMPFEKLAICIESPTVLQTTRAFLDRLESRFTLSQSSSPSSPENIDHLLKHLGSPKRTLSKSGGRTRVTPTKAARNSDVSKLPRYSPRIVLCAYMILGHPSVVFNERGEREKLLVESAENFVKEFELLIKTILDGSNGACILKQPMLDDLSPGSSNYQESSAVVADRKKFRSQLASFDKAWCAYLYHFVVWKAKDAKSLEEDLVRAACKLELSMMQTCKFTAEGQPENLNDNLKAIQKEVMVDQTLLREKVQHLGGEAGIERMEVALSEARTQFFEAKGNRSPLATTIKNVAATYSSGESPISDMKENSNTNDKRPSQAVQSLFRVPSSPSESNTAGITMSNPMTVSSTLPEKRTTENEQMVNEILHGFLADSSSNIGTVEGGFKEKVRETMEKAFWDVVVDSLRGDMPDYSYLVQLVKEVRDALYEMVPKGWKEEIINNIDLEILLQVLESGTQDMQYLGQILRYSLGMLRKLSSPAKEDEMKRSHDKLLGELIEHSECNNSGPNSFIIAVIKGLRFTMEELKALKAEVSRARIQLLEPIIKGSGGVEYLQKAFADRYGSPSNASVALRSTAQWISTSKDTVEVEWNEHVGSFSALPETDHAQPLVATLRSGHGVPDQRQSTIPVSDDMELPECTGQRLDQLIRIGLLQLISGIEGVQMQSVPETFKLNWLRLSMLVQRQVLATDDPNITPTELESATSELFNTLAELLDNFPDASTAKIMEVMPRSSSSLSSSSSSTTGSPSDERTESRKQILARVFLKSLQTDDPVFKKVSRSVYCAFRAITLGGSGARGRKLADAALRRIGATKLTGRVVRSAEILIRAATISQQVHGPWYNHLV